MPQFFLMLLVALSCVQSYAGSVCENLKKNSPDLYKMYCTKGGSGNTKPAGANSSFGEAFKLNPAALSPDQSSYGLEVIPTRLSNGAGPGFPNMALLSGFHRFGTGISTSGGNTFYSDDLFQRVTGSSTLKTLNDPEPAKGVFTNLNLGTSFLLFDPRWFPRVQIGLSGRYNRITNTIGGGPAILLSTRHLSFGYGSTKEKVSNYFPATTFTSILVGARIYSLELEFIQISTPKGATQSKQFSSVDLPPVQIFTASCPFHNFIFTAATRTVLYLNEGQIHQVHYAVQYFVNPHLAVGFLHNYIPGGNSLGLQLYL